MIYRYGVKNYFGFKEGAEVSFLLNSKVPKSISKGKKYTTVLGVKGANASGKTNLLKALGFLSRFCTNSFLFDESLDIDADAYYHSEEPSEFYVEFEIHGVIYKYELGATQKCVVYEKIYKKNKSEENERTRSTLIFHRKHQKIIKRTSELSQLDVIILKEKSSIISLAKNYKINQPVSALDDLYTFFSRIITNVGYTGIQGVEFKPSSVYMVSEEYLKNEELFAFVKNIIIKSDLGIDDIELRHRIAEDGKKVWFPLFRHVMGDGSYQFLSIYDESSGTKTLYNKLFDYWLALNLGGVLVLDEFDLSFHPLITPYLLELFSDENINKKQAQFIFTSHITELIDVLGKYRTYLVNKEDNQCFCYRLDEIKGDILRNDRLISVIYQEGKIGGVPKL